MTAVSSQLVSTVESLKDQSSAPSFSFLTFALFRLLNRTFSVNVALMISCLISQ